MDDARVYYFAARTEQPDFLGSPFPAPGVRVSFNPAALTAFSGREHWPSPYRHPWTRQGLLVSRAAMWVTAWPCRLWRVHHLEQPSTYDGRVLSVVRCASFEVIEEVPGWRVFGPHGAAVAKLIHEAEQLIHHQVATIAGQNGEEEWSTRTAVLNRWSNHLPPTPDCPTLPSPAGFAGTHLNDAVALAAARTGPHLFEWTDTATYWPELTDPTWLAARNAALAMTTALAVPELLHAKEATTLTCRWLHRLKE